MWLTEAKSLFSRTEWASCVNGGGNRNAEEETMWEVATSEESKSLKLRIWLIVDVQFQQEIQRLKIFPIAADFFWWGGTVGFNLRFSCDLRTR